MSGCRWSLVINAWADPSGLIGLCKTMKKKSCDTLKWLNQATSQTLKGQYIIICSILCGIIQITYSFQCGTIQLITHSILCGTVHYNNTLNSMWDNTKTHTHFYVGQYIIKHSIICGIIQIKHSFLMWDNTKWYAQFYITSFILIYFSSIVKQAIFAYVNHAGVCSWIQPVLSN